MWKKHFFIRVQITLWLFIVIALVIAWFSFWIYEMIKKSLYEETLVRLKNIAYLWSQTINPSEFEYLVNTSNKNLKSEEIKNIYKSKEFISIHKELENIKKIDPRVIKYVYTMTLTKDENKAKFIVDWDYFKDLQESSETITEFNEYYDVSKQDNLKLALREWRNIVENEFLYDEPYNINIVSWYAPIFNNKNELLWILWVDISDEWMQKYLNSSINLISIFILVSFVAAFVISLSFSGYITKVIWLKELLKDLEDSNKKLLELDNKKTNFLNIASHELRTPLTSINWYISMILDKDFWEINPEVNKHLNSVSGSVNYLLELVNEMLDIAKIDAWKQEVIFENFNLDEIINNVYANLDIVATKKWVKLKKQIKIEWKWLIYSCKKSIQKVLINLIWNAIKFTNSWWEVNIVLKENENTYTLIIQDTWVWIDKNDYEKIFEKFWQAWSSLNKESKWTWLWLYIVKKNIEKIWWVLCLDSELWKWTTFTISLPKKI